MEKRIITFLFFAFIMATAVFAENYRYYAFQKSGSSNILFVIMQTKEKLTDEQSENLEAAGGGALNTKQERLAAELGLDKSKSYYYMGILQPVFIDYTQDENDPDMKFLDSWEETMKYVRWEK